MATFTGQGGSPAADTELKRRLMIEVYRLDSTAPANSVAPAGNFTDADPAVAATPGCSVAIAPGFTSINFRFLRETANYDGTAGDPANGLQLGCMQYRPGYGPVYATALPALNAGAGSCYDFEVNAKAFDESDGQNPCYVEIIVERPIN